MLTKRQNFLETIKGGNPDRFVNQYEYMAVIRGGNPVAANNKRPQRGAPNVVNNWGITYSWPENVPGAFPVHDEEHIVVKDITKWRDFVHAPSLDYPQEEWDKYKANVEAIDRNEYFATYAVTPGVFEQFHHLQGVDHALINFYEEPEATKELLDYIVDFELAYAQKICENYHPDALFHHDDWGSYRSSFLSPAMFEEFIVPAYKKIYGFYKANGVEIIIHHSDSYAANLVPNMIDLGIDVWQGPTTTNNVPELVKQYGEKITFMGDLDNGVIDRADWSQEQIDREVRRACETNGKLYYIPCLVMGGPESVYPGVYQAVSAAIDKMSEEMF